MKPIDLQDSFSKAPLVAREQHIQQSSAEIPHRHLAAESDAERVLDRGRPVPTEEVDPQENQVEDRPGSGGSEARRGNRNRQEDEEEEVDRQAAESPHIIDIVA
jgi:hypothetical protein